MSTNPLEEEVLHTPLTREQIVARQKENGFVTGRVLLDPEALIDGDLESFLDQLSERLVDSSLGMEINYEAVAVSEGSIVFQVTLDPTMVLEVG